VLRANAPGSVPTVVKLATLWIVVDGDGLTIMYPEDY
jgi:hypothetical protein